MFNHIRREWQILNSDCELFSLTFLVHAKCIFNIISGTFTIASLWFNYLCHLSRFSNFWNTSKIKCCVFIFRAQHMCLSVSYQNNKNQYQLSFICKYIKVNVNEHTQRESSWFHMMTKPSSASILTYDTVLSIEMPAWLNGIVTLEGTKKSS